MGKWSFRLLAWVSVSDADTGAAGVVKTELQNSLDFELDPIPNRDDAFQLKVFVKLKIMNNLFLCWL